MSQVIEIKSIRDIFCIQDIWNNGMMEYWNSDLTLRSSRQSLKTRYSIVPSFLRFNWADRSSTLDLRRGVETLGL